MRSFRFVLVFWVALAGGRADSPTPKMKLVFSDDFNGAKIDTEKWTVGNPDQVTLKDGKVILGFHKVADGFKGGSISSKFSQSQGYFEAAIRFNAYRGNRSSFHIHPKDTGQVPSALLKFECAGDDELFPMARILEAAGAREFKPAKVKKQETYLKPGIVSKNANVYGFLWTPAAYVWYLNNKIIFKMDKPSAVGPMVLSIRHYSTEGDRKNFDAKNMPDDVDVDWVKIWK
ncbi:MAG: glycosyl hydrolase family protein [Opitutales bacterium]|nr:MAG: glycosyl hydrolase family protein [Opitutales bacterium]